MAIFGSGRSKFNLSGEKTTKDFSSAENTAVNALRQTNENRAQSKSVDDILASQRVSSGGDIFFSDTGQATSTSGGGTRSQTQITSEGLDAIFQKLMGGFEGFTSIASGSKKAGVYGSTTEAQQSADFLSKIIGEVARIMSPTITQELDKTITQGARNTAQVSTAKVETLGQVQSSETTAADIFAGTTSDNTTTQRNLKSNEYDIKKTRAQEHEIKGGF